MSQLDPVLADWLDTDTIVNLHVPSPSHSQSISELSPVVSLSDLPHVIPEHDEYHTMPLGLRHVLTPPSPEPFGRPRSILLEPALSNSLPVPSSPYSRHRWSPSDPTSGGVFRARQSVSSIGSSSTVQTRSAPVKSILARHGSGISMATTRSTRRRKRRSPPSVKFVDAPTVHFDHGVYSNAPPRSSRSPPSESPKLRWFTKWWKKSSTPPPRPHISGPYHISYTPLLVDEHASRAKPKPGRLKQLWHRLTNVIS